jgi:hypothetical protein
LFLRSNEAWLLKFNFKDGVALIEFRGARQITECEEKAGHNAEDNDPNSFDYSVPKAQKIQAALLFEIDSTAEGSK